MPLEFPLLSRIQQPRAVLVSFSAGTFTGIGQFVDGSNQSTALW